MQVIDLEQGSVEWLKWRNGGLSASEASVIMDYHVADPDSCDLPINPYKTIWRMWAEKSSLIPPDDLSKNPCVQRGNRLEDRARQFFEQMYGGEILLPVTAQSSEYPSIRCSFDGLDLNNIPHEIKVLMPSSFEDVLNLGEKSDAYRVYYPQVQVQMFVSGSSVGRLCFWEPEEDVKHLPVNYRVFEIQKDDEFIKAFLANAAKLHENIKTKTPPPMDKERDIFIPSVDDAAEWAVIATHTQELLSQKERLKRETEQNKEALEKAMSHLRGFMGDFRQGQFGGVKITRTDRTGSIDYKKIVDEKLNLSSDDLENYRRDGSTSWGVKSKEDRTILNNDNFTKTAPKSFPLSDLDIGAGAGIDF